MRIRPLTVRDAAAVTALAAELGYPAAAGSVAHRLAAAIADGGQLALGAEDEDGRLVAWLHASRAPRLQSPPQVEITALVVAAPRRGQGIGAALVAAAERWARQRGAAELRVRSRSERAGAHRFYRRAGFRALKTQQVFVRDLGPEEPAE